MSGENWQTTALTRISRAIHVIPIEDWIEHTEDADGNCPCEPRVDYFDPENPDEWYLLPVIIHNAIDGRD